MNKKNIIIVGIIFLMLSISDLYAREYVYDNAGFFSNEEKTELTKRLANIDNLTTVELVFYTSQSLNGKDIMAESSAVAQDLLVGKSGVNNGVLVFVAPADRKLIITVGNGIQWIINDSVNKSYIDTLFKYFGKNQKMGGIFRIVDLINQKTSSYKWNINRIEIDELKDLTKYSGQIISFPYTSKIRVIKITDPSSENTIKINFINIAHHKINIKLYYTHKMLYMIEKLNNHDMTIVARVSKNNTNELELLGVE